MHVILDWTQDQHGCFYPQVELGLVEKTTYYKNHILVENIAN